MSDPQTSRPPTSDAQVPPTRVTVVETPLCHFCTDAHQVLAELGAAYPLSVDCIDARSDPGRLLLGRHRAAMSPLVLVDGAFFSHGRLPRRKLAGVLAARYGTPDDPVAGGGGRRG